MFCVLQEASILQYSMHLYSLENPPVTVMPLVVSVLEYGSLALKLTHVSIDGKVGTWANLVLQCLCTVAKRPIIFKPSTWSLPKCKYVNFGGVTNLRHQDSNVLSKYSFLSMWRVQLIRDWERGVKGFIIHSTSDVFVSLISYTFGFRKGNV